MTTTIRNFELTGPASGADHGVMTRFEICDRTNTVTIRHCDMRPGPRTVRLLPGPLTRVRSQGLGLPNRTGLSPHKGIHHHLVTTNGGHLTGPLNR